MTPNPNQQPPADVVADFIAMISQACSDAGTVPPSFVANHQSGDQVLRSSAVQLHPTKRRHYTHNVEYHGLVMPTATADYEYDVTDDKIIVITDQDKGNVSVTNDMHNVVADITAQMGRIHLSGYLALYRDSLGLWDEIVISEAGRFNGIASLGGETETEALAILRARYGR